MKPKLLLGLALVLGGGLLGCSSVATREANDLTWPQQTQGVVEWQSPDSAKIIEERFAHASVTVLGNADDIAAIHQAIANNRPRLNLRMEELRWLSPTLAMARVRALESGYDYVIEKKDGRWSVLVYYLKWIS